MIIQAPFTKPRLGAQINRAHPIARGLIGYWIMNEGGGLRVNDISGYNNNGTLTNFAMSGATSNWAGSPFGGCPDFDGSDDCVNLGSPTPLQFTNVSPCSFSFWVYFSTSFSGVNYTMIAYSVGWYIVAQTTGAIIWDYGNPVRQRATSNALSINTWYHVVCTRDAANSTTSNKIYINGVDKTTNSNTGTPSSYSYAGKTAYIGTRDVLLTMKGRIDEVRIYNRQLSQAEIWQLYMQPHLDFLSFNMSMFYIPANQGDFFPFFT